MTHLVRCSITCEYIVMITRIYHMNSEHTVKICSIYPEYTNDCWYYNQDLLSLVGNISHNNGLYICANIEGGLYILLHYVGRVGLTFHLLLFIMGVSFVEAKGRYEHPSGVTLIFLYVSWTPECLLENARLMPFAQLIIFKSIFTPIISFQLSQKAQHWENGHNYLVKWFIENFCKH